MTSPLTGAFLALAIAGAIAAPASAKHGGHHNDVATAIAAGVVGAAIGAAISNGSSHDQVIYTPERPKPYRSGRFSPAAGIECVDRKQKCYHMGGGYSANWTRSVYGY